FHHCDSSSDGERFTRNAMAIKSGVPYGLQKLFSCLLRMRCTRIIIVPGQDGERVASKLRRSSLTRARSFETRSLPGSLAATRRGFAFYVAFPKSSIRPLGLTHPLSLAPLR